MIDDDDKGDSYISDLFLCVMFSLTHWQYMAYDLCDKHDHCSS